MKAFSNIVYYFGTGDCNGFNKDISIRCGVSVATVSKALNNHSDISETTKNHVLSVAKEMGYYPFICKDFKDKSYI